MKRAKILSASAGSGKTYQLAYKYVMDVILQPEMYRAILAVTFTNKATEEMKSRILREIHTLASGAKSPYLNDLCRELEMSEAKVRSQAMRARTLILHDYSRFSVLTIDKFFQRIIRAFIKELGIDLNYNIELDPSQLLARGADNLVEDIAGNIELKKWMLAFAQERLKDGHRWDMRGDLRTLGKEIFKEGSRDRMKMRQSKEELGKIVNSAIQDAEKEHNKLRGYAQDAIDIIDRYGLTPASFKGQSRSFVFRFEKYAKGDLGEPSATMKNALLNLDDWYGKDASDTVKSVAAMLQPLLQDICDNLPMVSKLINTASLLRNNYRSFALLTDLYDKINDICEKENIMILGETKHILSTFVDGSNAPFIYEKVGNRYERFMIDEFQDTSAREWENMLPLLQNAMAASDKCSVLIVGDVKQSIYRWRGGDWRLLKDIAKQDLGPSNIEPIVLKSNYRSLAKVVDFNNRMISEVVKRDNHHLNTVIDTALRDNNISSTLHDSLYNILESAYTDHEQNVGRKSDDEGYAEVTLFDSSVEDSPFIKIIEDAISRGYRYRDILILVRGATDSRKVVDLLFKYKEQRFTSRGEVGFNVHTADALTIENCDVADFIIALFRLTTNINDAIERGIYNRFLGKRFDHKFDDAEQDFIKHIAHLSPMEAFEQIVAQYKLYERKDRIAHLQAMQEGIHSFSTSRISDIQRYLVWWDERGKNEKLSVDMTDDTIEISTIHKAKGLERDVVIIPYCNWGTVPNASLQTVIWSQASSNDIGAIGEFPVTYGSAMQNSLFTADYYSEVVMSHVDAVNLLYVAMTRASKELYMLVPTAKSDNTIRTIVPLLVESVAKVAGEPEVSDGVTVYRYGSKIEHQSHESKPGNNIILDSYTSQSPKVSVRTPNRKLEEESETLSNDLRRMGQHMHKIFEQATTVDEINYRVDNLANHSLISKEEAEHLKSTIDKALADDIVHEWFNAEWDDIKSEVDIITQDSCRRPDRVMIKDRRAVVVDYKFSEHTNNRYNKQVSEYMQLLSSMKLYDTIEGYVWYIPLGKVVKVE